jgi:anthranilate phosphoribosyltransferase
MKTVLNTVLAHQALSKEEAYESLVAIGKGSVDELNIAAFLVAIQSKGLSVDELEGFREAMLELSIKVKLDRPDCIDVCGTGGDGKDTFNISTCAAFIIAGAGQPVAKHGNHGVSSSVGSSTVLEELGIKFTDDTGFLNRCIEEAGFCYMHAPLFHPAMRYVGPVRKALGIKTFFNILGPLLNPARVNRQVTGVYNLETFELYEALYLRSQSKFGVLHSLDDYDEISLTGPFILSTQNKQKQEFLPERFGYETLRPEVLHGASTAKASAKILIDILENQGSSAQCQVVLANAAVALMVAEDTDLDTAFEKAKDSLLSGKAREVLRRLNNIR